MLEAKYLSEIELIKAKCLSEAVIIELIKSNSGSDKIGTLKKKLNLKKKKLKKLKKKHVHALEKRPTLSKKQTLTNKQFLKKKRTFKKK